MTRKERTNGGNGEEAASSAIAQGRGGESVGREGKQGARAENRGQRGGLLANLHIEVNLISPWD